MPPRDKNSCPGCRRPSGIDRRKFISYCSKGAALAAGSFLLKPGLGAAEKFALVDFTSRSVKKQVKVRLLFALHRLVQNQPDWPNVGFDFSMVIKKYTETLIKRLPSFDFLTATSSGPEETRRIIAKDLENGVDGYVVFQLNCWNQVIQPVVETGRPVIYVDFQFGGSGGFLVYTANYLRKQQPNLGFIASSDFEQVIAAVQALEEIKRLDHQVNFSELIKKIRMARTPSPNYLKCYPDYLNLLSAEETIYRLKNSPILLFRDARGGENFSLMGVPVLNLPFSELNRAWQEADRGEAREIAETWWNRASLIQGVKFSEVENSAAMYLGMKALLKKYDARAITINCLGGFYGGHLQAYPCLGFHELNNQGLVGACEADLRSTATMLSFGLMTQGRPGYISDPVIDTSRRQIIYAHCVASNRVFGPHGPDNPIEILTHSEDRQGASVRSILPSGYLTTSLQIDPQKEEILLHQAKAVGNSSDDRACRTKLVAEPIGDIEKLFREWDEWGWHRVTFYGDLKKPAYELAESFGWKVKEEA
ncbi:MAG TPA: hypothetical protein ENO29_04750 [Candidatus Aminicenantes bacterium]|nr:MAG: hypothetical protein C0168_04105 [Candidatus Aminicenantes bacterium]HEK85644.1 hypothetical protein [Candidatus Aminicenantes bacterium]